MTIEELRVLITAKTESLQDGINKATAKLQNFKKTSDDASSSMDSSIKSMQRKLESLNSSFEKTRSKISNMQSELAGLYAKQDTIIEKYRDMPAFSGMTKDESLERMLASDKGFKKVADEIDKIQAKMQPLIDKNRQTKEEIKQLGQAMDETANKTQSAGNRIKEATNSTGKLGKTISDVGYRAKRSTGKIAGFAAMLNKSFMRVLKRIFILNLIYKMIRGLINYINGALKTNNQFAASLNTIRTNLRVAFQPIYDFILPAINALMKALATATTYIATFTSALFGKTYKQSYDAAKGIEAARKAMDGYGKAAKGTVAGFDEINQLSIDDSDGAGDFEMAMPDMEDVEVGPIEKLKESLTGLFKPLKDTWDIEGKRTIESAKNAFNSIKSLISEIGNSFKRVWLGGDGHKILEIQQRILQEIFDLVGKIGESFKNAWTENETGIAIIQGISDIFSSILEVIESIGESLGRVWGEIGQDVADAFMSIFETTTEVLGRVTESLKKVWDNGGKHLFESLIKLGAKIFELAGYVYTEFVAPFVGWFVELISPAIGKVLDWVAKLLDKFTELIDWLLGDGKPVLDTIVTVLGSMAIAFGVVKLAIFAYNVVMGIATGISTAFGAVMAFITSPIGIVVIAIGAVIAIGTLLYKHWDEISAWLKATWESIKQKAIEIWDVIKQFFIDTWDAITTKTKEIWEGIKLFLIDKIWNPIKTSAQEIWEGIKKFIIEPIQAAWNKLKEIWTKIKTYILGKWNEIKQGIVNMKNNLIDAIMSPFRAADKLISDVIGNAKNWGRNLISNFIDGIKAMMGKVKDAVSNVANTVKDFLGFSSPAKRGPGAEADKWMPNLMDMLAEGIKDNVYKVNASVNMTADALKGVEKADNSNAIASAVGSAVLGAVQAVAGQSTNSNKEFVLEINGRQFIRAVLDDLNGELTRMGYKSIYQT